MFISYISSLRLYAMPFKPLTCIMKPQFQINPSVWFLCHWTTEDFWRKLQVLQDLLYLTFPQYFLLLYLSPPVTWHSKMEIFLSPFCHGDLLILLPKSIVFFPCPFRFSINENTLSSAFFPGMAFYLFSPASTLTFSMHISTLWLDSNMQI